MSETRLPLASSSSFSGSPSIVATRPLKRRLTSPDLSFFTPAASSFKPRPYIPKDSTARQPKHLPSSHHRSFDAIPTPIMDPSPTDPAVIFIHPPFTSFPEAHLIPEGLSYSVMTANPHWFLDPNDFISATSTNPHAIPYPPHLEPPRGWCPSRKKDLKSRGASGWPEGEEPRLRCTFCRRTYAGVNAKSMWRRHVFEKHKIAMSNRRDGLERPRGRGSGKENRLVVGAKRCDEPSLKVNNAKTTQPDSKRVVPAPEFSILPPSQTHQTCDPTERTNQTDRCSDLTPFPGPVDHGLSQPYPTIQSWLPPNTDHPWSPSKALTSTDSPILTRDITSHLPYDPLLSPSFHHSPLRLPSDQPWRFPSPSHPLYSKQQDLCLAMLAQNTITPLTKCNSPTSISPIQATLLSIPSVYDKDQFGSDRPTAHNDKSRPPSPLGWSTDDCAVIDPRRISHDPFADVYNSWVDLSTAENDISQESCDSAVPVAEVESPVLRSSTLPTELSCDVNNLSEESLYEYLWLPLSDHDGNGVVDDVQASPSLNIQTNRPPKRDIDSPSPTRKRRKLSDHN